MVSISHVVEDIVKHRPYLSESLAAGIINVSSLARQLQPDVERALQKGVNTGAIVMALNRPKNPAGSLLPDSHNINLKLHLSTHHSAIVQGSDTFAFIYLRNPDRWCTSGIVLS